MVSSRRESVDRRRFLAAAAAVAGGVVTGCSGDGGTGEQTNSGPGDIGSISGSITGFQGGPGHAGKVATTGPMETFASVWTARLGRGGYENGSPLLLDGTLYFAEKTGGESPTVAVRALDAQTGEEQWAYTAQGPESLDALRGTSIEESTLVQGFADRLVGLHTADGSVRWERSIDPQRAPVTADGTVYVTTDGGAGPRVRAFAVESGEPRWEQSVDKQATVGRAAPAVDGDTVYVAGAGLEALSASDGSRRWSASLDEPPATAPAVGDGAVYVGTVNNGVAAISTGEQRQRWWSQVEESTLDGVERSMVPESPAVDSQQTVVAVSLGAATGLNVDSGEQAWSTATDGASGPPMIDKVTAYVSGIDNVVALSTGDGSTVGSFGTDAGSSNGRGAPAVADGVVYAPIDGLYALK